ncbi:MAG TPA: family 10 glycosylhydrolase [Povalibacter sp.]|nr:family 10 glycosylhydrolase [Povalibacter sp.]
MLQVAVCAADVERFDPPTGRTKSTLTLHDGARFAAGRNGTGLVLPGNSYAEWSPGKALSTQAGTLTMWVSPLWSSAERSHTFLSFRWSGNRQSYFALSQGWWEPGGERKLYGVLSNQDFAFCLMPWKADYTLYLPNQWTQLGVTWQAGNPGVLRLYVDGKCICERRRPFAGDAQSTAPLFLGADRGTTDQRGRAADFIIDDLTTLPYAVSNEQMWTQYRQAGGDDRSKWLLAITSAGRPRAPATENRVMVDEGDHWSRSTTEMRRTIDRLSTAGFNIYVPCIWDGGRALFPTDKARFAAWIRNVARPEDDPLQAMIAYAHQRGIQVHPWFIVAGRPAGDYPAEFIDGAPTGAFNVQSESFRRFIADVIVDVAKRYDVDGINLDYIRSVAVCTSKQCAQDYRAEFGRSLEADWQLQQTGQVVPSLVQWNRRAVTDIVRRIAGGVREARPGIPISIDSVPFDHSRMHQGVDDAGWLRDKLIDGILYMSYDDPMDIEGVSHAVSELGGEHLVILARNYDPFDSRIVDRSGALIADYVELKRTLWPASGIGFYHYPHFTNDQASTLRARVFRDTAEVAWPARDTLSRR